MCRIWSHYRKGKICEKWRWPLTFAQAKADNRHFFPIKPPATYLRLLTNTKERKNNMGCSKQGSLVIWQWW